MRKEFSNSPVFQDDFTSDSLSAGVWRTHSRVDAAIADGRLKTAGGWVSAGDAELKHYSLKFRARAPREAGQVQIWAGFRHFSPDFRYVVALRGGNNNHLYLARYGVEGYDKMLALEPLTFSPMPDIWYDIEVIAAGNTIAVYLGTDELPTIVVRDEDAPFGSGGISLGGSYLATEFDNVRVTPVEPGHLDGITAAPGYLEATCLSEAQKKDARRQQRAAYKPLAVQALHQERMEVSLDRDWLFIPDYETDGEAAAPHFDDSSAHVMQVPQAWVPLRGWLEGEEMEDMGKGMNDSYILSEQIRCGNYTFDSEKTNHAWYRQYIDLPRDISSKRVVVDFEGVALISSIYINGKKLHENVGMFNPFEVDISDQVQPGRNVLSLCVFRTLSGEAIPSTSDATADDNYTTAWNIIDATEKGEELETKTERREFCTEDIPHGFYEKFPGGIWRPVKLVITSKVRVDECYWVPTLKDAAVEVEYSNGASKAQDVELSYEIREKASGELLCGGLVEKSAIEAGASKRTSFKTPKVSPRLWAPGSPNLYNLTFFLRQE